MSEQLARQFHEIYERLAPSFGYETRTETRAFEPTTPNGRLMIAVTDEIEAVIQQRIAELTAELARRDEQIAELTATTRSQAFRNAELSRFVWWVYQVYARNVQELTSGITEACTYETEEKAEKGKYGLPIRCWEYIRYLEEYTAGIYNGTYLDSETSTVVKRDLSDFEINELGAQEAEKRGEK